MPAARKTKMKATPAKKQSAPTGAVSKRVAVKGDERVKVIAFSKPKKVPAPKKLRAEKKEVSKEPSPAVLISVSIDDGPAKVARYAGLFFVLVGACFASYSLSGLYVEMVELSTSSQFVTTARHQAASIITANQDGSFGTTTTVNTAPTSPALTPIAPTLITTTATTSLGEPVPEGGTTEEAVTTSTQSQDDAAFIPLVIEPEVRLAVQGGDTLHDKVYISIRVLQAERVELVLIPRTSLVERYLGKAMRKDIENWAYPFDTHQVPNGEYRLFARVTNKYGSYTSERRSVRVQNELPTQAPPSDDQMLESDIMTTAIEAATADLAEREPKESLATEIKTFIAPQTNETTQPVTLAPTPSRSVTAPDDEPSADEPEEPIADLPDVVVDPVIDAKANLFIETFDTDFKKLLDLYGVAMRSGDTAGITLIRERLVELRRQSLDRVETELVTEGGNSDFAQQVRDRIAAVMQGAEERREKEERLILDRVGEKIKRDSDRDGVSDYDETNLYTTDPFTADSDADGFTDGAEILSGYDPKSEAREVAVAFEDPRKAGTLRTDILSVERLDVLAFAQSATSTAPQEEKIIFSGTALPNSFVTLYIFSTPIVVTVKTHEDGSWNYAFDKELEEGQHEVFVGITDNAGKLVAKSVSFPFVKTANAYSVGRISEQPVAVPVPAQSLFSESALVLTMSLVVMMVGLVLVLIGAHLAKHAKPHLLATPTAASV